MYNTEPLIINEGSESIQELLEEIEPNAELGGFGNSNLPIR